MKKSGYYNSPPPRYSGSCGRGPCPTSLSGIVKHYEHYERANFENLLIQVRKAGSFEKQVHFACKSKFRTSLVLYQDRKVIHPHQRRIGAEKLEKIAAQAVHAIDQYRSAVDFLQVHSITEHVIRDAIGLSNPELTAYDISLRIGAVRDIFPTQVYLHTGARTGAMNLFCRMKEPIPNRHRLDIGDLPEPLHSLKPQHIENLLCIYKECFPNLDTLA